MSALSAAAPAVVREDDGFYGPDSVSWRLFADPSSKLGGVAAVLLQALFPQMMLVFDGASGYATDMAGRSERTARYIETTIFGDRAHAEAAGASVRRMHAHARWTDPRDGVEYSADTQAWLEWTHNTVTWGVLRGAEEFGPALTPAEQDTFVKEQHIAARLAGVNTEHLASTRAELDAYFDDQAKWMALTPPAAQLVQNMRKPGLRGNPIKVWSGIIIQDGILWLLPDWARDLYGIEGRPMNLRAAARTTKRMIATARRSAGYDQILTEITDRVDTQPYRKLRAAPAHQQ